MGRSCIVCGKPIPKKTASWYIRQAREERAETYKEVCGHKLVDQSYLEAKPHGTIERTSYSVVIYLNEAPKTKAECQLLTNQKVISVKHGHDGIYHFTAWDELSYQDEFFHSQTCAAEQGRASALHGARFTWSKTVDE